jgi:hypothetical protein
LGLFFVFFERERTSEANEQRFMEKSPPRAEGEKALPLRVELDVMSGGHVEGDSPTSGPFDFR